MITIQTNTDKETKSMSGIRDSLRAMGQEVFLVPEGIECIWVTLVELDENNHDLAVILQDSQDDEHDRVVGFENCRAAYKYAERLATLCGIDTDGVWGDVSDMDYGFVS